MNWALLFRLSAFVIAALVLALDQASKHWALMTLQPLGTTMALPGPVDLTLVFNHSNAFGLVPVSGDITRWTLTIVNLGVAAFLAWLIAARPLAWPTAIGSAFIIAGAVGNAIDRIAYGVVIDFFNASKLGFIWVFNVADASIDIGIAFYLLGLLSHPQPKMS